MELKDHFVELIRRSSTSLQPDVEAAITKARDTEDKGSSARGVFEAILDNVHKARENSTPICQDTGALMFEISCPKDADQDALRAAATAATEEATKKYYLRPNAVHPITGKNSGTNVGINVPVFHFHPWDEDHVAVRLMQKGGGSENVSGQFKLPDSALHAGRDLKGVFKGVLRVLYNAQGKGCAPGIVGIGIGGDRTTGFLLAKEQLFRKPGQRSEDPELARLEKDLYNEINSMGIGPMGLGGKTTVLEVFAGVQHRHPATFFVSVAYMCWACRRASMTIKGDEVTYD